MVGIICPPPLIEAGLTDLGEDDSLFPPVPDGPSRLEEGNEICMPRRQIKKKTLG